MRSKVRYINMHNFNQLSAKEKSGKVKKHNVFELTTHTLATQVGASSEKIHPSPEQRRSSLAHLHGDIAGAIEDVSKQLPDSPQKSNNSSRVASEISSPPRRRNLLAVHL